MQARGPVPFRDHRADGIVLPRHGAQAIGDGFYPRLIQQQPVHHRVAQSLFAAKLKVLGIGRDDLGAALPDRIGGGIQRLGLGL